MKTELLGGWTVSSTKWYGSAINKTALMNALETSLLVAVIAMAISITIGLIAALAIP